MSESGITLLHLFKIIKRCINVGNFLDSNSIIKMNGVNSDVNFINMSTRFKLCGTYRYQYPLKG
jgi:hypothetical protein